LVEVHGFRIDGDEAGDCAAALRDYDVSDGCKFVAPALAPPIHALAEFDVRVGCLPSAPPQLDRRVFVGGSIGP
jgi:hypothetical protein